MQNLALFPLAMVIGGTVTVYLTVNSFGAEKIDSDLKIIIPYFLVALLSVLLVQFVKDGPPSLSTYAKAPWWVYLTGVAGAFVVFASTLVVGKMGPDKFFVASVAGQMIVAVIISHFGWLNAEETPIDWKKIVGVLLAVAGAVLVSWKEA